MHGFYTDSSDVYGIKSKNQGKKAHYSKYYLTLFSKSQGIKYTKKMIFLKTGIKMENDSCLIAIEFTYVENRVNNIRNNWSKIIHTNQQHLKCKEFVQKYMKKKSFIIAISRWEYI